jgi:hypothetical protein
MNEAISAVDDTVALRCVPTRPLSAVGDDLIEAGYDVEVRACPGALAGRERHLIDRVKLPRMDGIGFATQREPQTTFKSAPALRLASGDDEVKGAERSAGASASVLKALSPAHVLDAVANLILP